MFKAMALKELREIWGITAGIIIIYGILLFMNLPAFWGTHHGIPFVQRGELVFGLCFLAGLLAALLGLWQTFGESVRGTYLFLLHRPTSFRWLIGMKLFVGLAVYMIVAAIPLLIYGIWAATPGNHASPFQWSMTIPTWGAWFAMTMLYLGTFLTGIRPGRWYGARFLPLAATAIILFIVLRVNFDFGGTFWLCGIVLAVDLWIITLIFLAAKSRDYS